MGTQVISLPTHACPHCNGTGRMPGISTFVGCMACGGSGLIFDSPRIVPTVRIVQQVGGEIELTQDQHEVLLDQLEEAHDYIIRLEGRMERLKAVISDFLRVAEQCPLEVARQVLEEET